MEFITNIVKEEGITDIIFDNKKEIEMAELIKLSQIVEENINIELNFYIMDYNDEKEEEYEKISENTMKSIDDCLNKVLNYIENNNINIIDNYNDIEVKKLLSLLDFCYEKDYIFYIGTNYEKIYNFTQGKYQNEINDYEYDVFDYLY